MDTEKTTQKTYRENLPPIPERLLKRPVQRGYPVPWFVAEIDGHYDFRLADPSKIVPATKQNLCWTCGERLGSVLAFTIGPMCAINRVISEPPSHRECAEFSIKACPFLAQQRMNRRENNLPDGVRDPAVISIKRQPGAVLLWLTKSYRPFRAPGGAGILYRIGAPVETFWFREGRRATRAEIMESIETGLPILREMAQKEGPVAVAQLEKQITKGLSLVPADERAGKIMLGSAAKAKAR